MDKLKAMQTFVQIADLGSLTAAARAAETSLPTVVRTLAALEAELQVRLFTRTTRRIALTDEGRRYLEACRRVLADIAEAEHEAGAGAKDPYGRLCVTAPVLFGQLHVAPAITRFVQRHPGVKVDVRLHDAVLDLLEQGIDVGVRIGALADSSLIARRVGQVRRVVVASTAFLRRHGVPAHPRELQAAPCVRYDGAVTSWTFYDAGKALAVPVSGSLTFNHVAPAVDACVAGAGFGIFMSYQVARAVEQRQLVRVLEAFQPPPRPIHVVYPQARLLPARSRVFIDWMVRELKGFQA